MAFASSHAHFCQSICHDLFKFMLAEAHHAGRLQRPRWLSPPATSAARRCRRRGTQIPPPRWSRPRRTGRTAGAPAPGWPLSTAAGHRPGIPTRWAPTPESCLPRCHTPEQKMYLISVGCQHRVGRSVQQPNARRECQGTGLLTAVCHAVMHLQKRHTICCNNARAVHSMQSHRAVLRQQAAGEFWQSASWKRDPEAVLNQLLLDTRVSAQISQKASRQRLSVQGCLLSAAARCVLL